MAHIEDAGLSQDENESKAKRMLKKMPGAKYLMNQLNARKHHSKLDEASRKQETQHMRALQNAKLRHDNVRSAAEAAQAEYDLQQARRARKDQRRQEVKRQQAIEAKRLLLDQEQKLYEQQLRQHKELEIERERLRSRRLEEEKLAQIRFTEQARKEKEDDERRQAAKTQEVERAKKEEAKPAEPPSSRPAQANTSQPANQRLGQHQQYLELHRRLKQMRKQMEDAKAQIPQLKKELGELRRGLRSQFGMFTSDAANNRNIVRRMKELFAEAERVPCPRLNVLDYIIRPLPTTVNMAENQVPGIRIYLINFLAKALVQKMAQIGSSLSEGEQVGLATVVVMMDPNTQWQGVPLTDIVLAKFHKSCPVLFGKQGDERTQQGRENLGWPRTMGKDSPFADEQRATEKWTGMGAVFAALTLRQFNNQQITMAPFPRQLYWESMTAILNTKPADRTQAHYFLLKGLIEHAVPNVVKTFGRLGIALVNTAVSEFPQDSKVAGADFVRLLQKTLQRDHHLAL